MGLMRVVIAVGLGVGDGDGRTDHRRDTGHGQTRGSNDQPQTG